MQFLKLCPSSPKPKLHTNPPVNKIEPNTKLELCQVKVESKKKQKAVDAVREWVGCPYNKSFSEQLAIERKEFYCCQLIRHAYSAVDQNFKFPTRKMKFTTADGKVSNVWEKYFAKLGCKVPYDEIGSHPSDLRQCDLIEKQAKLTINYDELPKSAIAV